MAVKTEYKISCHKCGKIDDLYSSTKAEATAEAKRLGWNVTPHTNRCPDCSR
jgi:hypothetical protein